MIQDYHPWYYTVILFSSVLLLRRSGRSEEWSKHGACRSQPTSRINLIQRFSTFQPCSEFPRSNLPTEAPPFRNSAQSYWSSSGGEHSGEEGSRMTSAREDVDPPFEIYSTIWRTGELYLVARISAHVAREEFSRDGHASSIRDEI